MFKWNVLIDDKFLFFIFQGMAYSLLGNLEPVVGMYMAFFPVIVYSFMGTSRHVSMGASL